MVTNNGKFRRTTFVLRRYVNGIERTDGTFPVVENITHAFADQPSVSVDEFTYLTDPQYLNRLSLFYNYLEFKYPFFKRENYPSLEQEAEGPHGTNALMCPIDSVPSEGLSVNFDFDVAVNGGDSRGILDVVLENANNQSAFSSAPTQVGILIKEHFGASAVNWDTVSATRINVTIPAGASSLNVLPQFRFKGINLGDMDFKNIHARIVQVENSGSPVVIGSRNIVFTTPGSDMVLGSIITNLDQSYQDFPTDETLRNEIATNPGIDNTEEIIFVFPANVPMRPVLIVLSDYSDIAKITTSEEADLDLLSTGAFVKQTKTLTVNGEQNTYKVYAAANQVVYSNRVEYKFSF